MIKKDSFRNISICLAFLIVGGILSTFLKTEFLFDFLQYHYYNGFAFVNNRHNIDLGVAALPTYYNPLLDAAAYLLIRFCGENLSLYYFITGLPFGLLMFIFFKICLLFFDPASIKGKIQITFAVLIAATGFHVFSQIGSISHDISSNVFILAAFYLLLRKDKSFLAAGFLLGTGAALKLSGVIYCVSFGISLILMYKKLPDPLKNLSRFILGGFLGFMAFNGFWMYFLWEQYQNPFFPFWNKIFKSPYYLPINYIDKIATEYMIAVDFILYPFYLVLHSSESNIIVNADVTDARLALLFIIGFGAVFFFFKKKEPFSPVMKEAGVFMAVSYIVCLFLSALSRFLIPVEMFAAIVIVSCFSRIKYPQKTITEGLYWSAAILLCFLLFSTPYYSDSFGRRTETEFLKEKITLPEKTLIYGFGVFAPAFIARLMETNPTAAGIGFRLAEKGNWFQINMPAYGKMTEITQKMREDYQNQVAFVTEAPIATLLPPQGEKAVILKGWLCEPLSIAESYNRNFRESLKLCFPPEMKEKIVIERK
ncbi:MAG: hypothetical protein J5787_04150 [Alphaproteobacteria bacterium]|nr:hypothetical protein [Alphaproteobacteria bacterium]